MTNISEALEVQRQLERELAHAQLRIDALTYFADNEGDPIEFLNFFAEKVRILLGCDQVIYRDLEETRVMVNSPEIAEQWSVPIEYCQQCQHFDAYNPIYSDGVTEMYDCSKGFRGVPTYHLCPIKSSLTRIVTVDGEVNGYLAIHYLKDFHQFNDVERRTLEEITKILSLSLSRYRAKEHEAQFQQLQDALAMSQAANRAKTAFLNNMSHDIRTPMNAIVGYTGLAASHIDNKERVKEYLTKISKASEHLLSLINDVLDMSRIESGKMNLEERPENISEIIHRLRDIVQADVNSKKLDFYIDSVDVKDEGVICDKLRLNQVLLNLVSNSIKYTPAGGTVSLRIMQKSLTKTGYGVYEFHVKDNGVGMTEEFLETIFDPFTRAKNSTASGVQGTGLGMAITKNIVDMMGGFIEIDSEPEVGTEVIVTLEMKVQEAPSQPSEIPELKGLSALVVDDNSSTCLSVAKMVREVGMRADWCTSGKEAVIRARDNYQMGEPFKVYILDWQMPDMNGIETTRQIRKEIGDDVPIVILTAYDWSDLEEEARAAGVTTFVSKPLFPSDLRKVLCECIEMEEAAEEQAAEEQEEKKHERHEQETILLVEDNEFNREIACAQLEEEGYHVEAVEDGHLAVERLSKAKPGEIDLVLMDIQMPTMDGCEATRQIRKLGTEMANIPIIAMTANAFEEDREMALDAGMDDYIAKPVDLESLLAMIEKYLP